MEKMTNKKALLYVKENFTDMPDDVAEKIDAMITSLDKKSASKKPTKIQIENENLKEIILTVLTELDVPTTASAIGLDPRVNANSQKVAPILKKLGEEGKVLRTEEKGRAYFSIKVAEE